MGVGYHGKHDHGGVRPSIAVEGWLRRWENVADGTLWGQERGLRVEPRFAVQRTVGGPWTKADHRTKRKSDGERAGDITVPKPPQSRLLPVVEVAGGLAAVLFDDGDQVWWGFSPIVAGRASLRLGNDAPWFLAVDLRVGIHRRSTECYPNRPHCPDVLLNPGGTALGALLGKAL